MDFQINGVNYKANRLPTTKQFHIVRRCAPLLAGITDKDKALESIFNGIGNLKDDDADFILFGLLASVQRDQSPHGWSNITVGNSLMFDDIDLPVMLQIAAKVFEVNFSGFLAALPSDLRVGK